MARDSLRAALDDLKLDPESAKDRPYLEAMLLRLGYTETEIREELGPIAEASPNPTPAPAGDELAPSREYRLVVPARESAFSFEPVSHSPNRQDSPFEAFDRVEFEAANQVEFEATQEPEALEFTEMEAEEPVAAAGGAGMATEEFQEAPLQEFQEAEPTEEPFEQAPVETLKADEAGAGVEDVGLDTFGTGSVDTQPKTRVRVKRVRARSKAEAEGKVASSNRKVIKSIPVDIVERWGPAGKPDDKDAKDRKGAK